MQRRSFLSGIPALGFMQAPAAALRAWQAARHPQDDWFDDNTATHRVIFDTWNAEHFPDAMQFSGNFFETSKTDYNLPAADLALVICCRHRTTPFAFNDAMWAKYGKSFSAQMEWTDTKTGTVPTANPYTRLFTALAAQGLKLAICNRTAHAYANRAARDAGLKNDDVYRELTGNTVIPGRTVPAGIIAVTRAQERGYALVAVG